MADMVTWENLSPLASDVSVSTLPRLVDYLDTSCWGKSETSEGEDSVEPSLEVSNHALVVGHQDVIHGQKALVAPVRSEKRLGTQLNVVIDANRLRNGTSLK
ncbi:MAG: hypothetical protein WD646_13405 [Actinomycetota bacterium]